MLIISTMLMVSEQDTLRKRFAMAMQWYGMLVNETFRSVQRKIDTERYVVQVEKEDSKIGERSRAESDSEDIPLLSLPLSSDKLHLMDYTLLYDNAIHPYASVPTSSSSSRASSPYRDDPATPPPSLSPQPSTSEGFKEGTSGNTEETHGQRKPNCRERQARMRHPSEYLQCRCPICFGGRGCGRSW